jgi:2',3'-cyclic-nucleotide 2'-phosphodiesterase (5'-nucleotidase family)
VFQAHADWKVNLVVGGHCRQPYDKQVGEVRMYSPGKRFEQYVRAQLKLDASRPAGQKVTGVDAKVVDVGDAQPDVRIEAAVSQWKQKLDEALGEEIGFTQNGFKQDSPEMVNWITTAWREQLEADVGLINKGGIRQDLPPGKITRASVYSVLPFENSLMIVNLPGEALIKALDNGNAKFGGVTKAGKGYKDAKGKAIDPKATYKVATVEFLYFGGDGFELEQHDPLPTETGQVWQTPVISWTRKQNTSEQKPLESALKK